MPIPTQVVLGAVYTTASGSRFRAVPPRPRNSCRACVLYASIGRRPECPTNLRYLPEERDPGLPSCLGPEDALGDEPHLCIYERADDVAAGQATGRKWPKFLPD